MVMGGGKWEVGALRGRLGSAVLAEASGIKSWQG